MLKEIFLDNYKGFENQFLPISKANFFVGENSTGKSAIIKAIDVILKTNDTNFDNTQWFDTLFTDIKTIGSKKRAVHIGFSDMIRERFIEEDRFDKEGKLKTVKSEIFFYYRIGKSSDGFPQINKGIMYNTRTYSIIGFNITKNNVFLLNKRSTEKLSFQDFISKTNYFNFTNKKLFANEYLMQETSLHLLFMFAGEDKNKFINRFGGNTDSKLFSPIRSLPKAMYTRTRKNRFSALGEHMPNTLASSMFNDKHLSEMVNDFGKSSGLFDSISIKKLSKGINSNFTIQVVRANTSTRIDQVGTGVSQVLPIICEVLNGKSDVIYLLQQPELHLHPKAQSSLGKFFYDIKEKDNNFSFIAETHSEYLIDSFRRHTTYKNNEEVLIQFFTSENSKKRVYTVFVDKHGKYYGEGLMKYREFYLNESIRNISL